MAQALPYYDYHALLTRNGTFNFVVGGRGLGKTYGAKKQAIKDYARRGDQFIYLRRYKSELSSRHTFFADLMDDEYIKSLGLEMRVNGNVAEARKMGDDSKGSWKIMGYFIALSNALTQKSVAYPRVTKIIFDEFIIQKGALHYLPDEVKALQELYSTVDRWKDKTKVFFLANALSIMNPYFVEYDIQPKQVDEWIVKGDGFLVAHFPEASAFASAVYKTKFGSFIKDTEYSEYAISSVFADNSELMLRPKPDRAKYYCTIETELGMFSVWMDMHDPEVQKIIFYVQEVRPAGNELILTTVFEKMSEDKTYVEYGDKILSALRSAFNHARVYFSSAKARNSFGGLFKR